jgi:Mg2+ and Co2+ transporter CorA
VDPVELLSATGTFLAAVAALASVYAIVFDEVPQRLWEVVIGSWWLLGIVMQVSAGLIGRSRLASKAVG